MHYVTSYLCIEKSALHTWMKVHLHRLQQECSPGSLVTIGNGFMWIFALIPSRGHQITVLLISISLEPLETLEPLEISENYYITWHLHRHLQYSDSVLRISLSLVISGLRHRTCFLLYSTVDLVFFRPHWKSWWWWWWAVCIEWVHWMKTLTNSNACVL